MLWAAEALLNAAERQAGEAAPRARPPRAREGRVARPAASVVDDDGAGRLQPSTSNGQRLAAINHADAPRQTLLRLASADDPTSKVDRA